MLKSDEPLPQTLESSMEKSDMVKKARETLLERGGEAVRW